MLQRLCASISAGNGIEALVSNGIETLVTAWSKNYTRKGQKRGGREGVPHPWKGPGGSEQTWGGGRWQGWGWMGFGLLPTPPTPPQSIPTQRNPTQPNSPRPRPPQGPVPRSPRPTGAGLTSRMEVWRCSSSSWPCSCRTLTVQQSWLVAGLKRSREKAPRRGRGLPRHTRENGTSCRTGTRQGQGTEGRTPPGVPTTLC